MKFQEYLSNLGTSATFVCEKDYCQFEYIYDTYYFDQPGSKLVTGAMFIGAWGIGINVNVTWSNPDPDYFIEGAFYGDAFASIGLSGIQGPSGVLVNAYTRPFGPGEYDGYFEGGYDRSECAGYGTVTCGIEFLKDSDWPGVPEGSLVTFSEDSIVGPIFFDGEIRASLSLDGLSGGTSATATMGVFPFFAVDVAELNFEEALDEPHVIPLPAALPLFVSGIAALVAARWRERASNRQYF